MADLQAWFGRAITRPLPPGFQGNPLAAGSPELKEQGDALVRGRGGLSGFDRLGLYNQQYWFRLVGIMQGEYGCALRLMGLDAYNQWAIRYLDAHPPSSPYLSRLDEAWPAFMEERYQGPDRAAVLQAIAFDRAFSRAFDAPDGRPLSGAEILGEEAPEADTPSGPGGLPVPDPGRLMALPLQLAPHVTVLRMDWDFAAYRARCLADEGLEETFELGPRASCMVIWRGRDLVLWQQEVSSAACKVLRELETPATVPEAFDRLEGSLTEGEQAELEANLAAWFGEWVRNGWIGLGSPPARRG